MLPSLASRSRSSSSDDDRGFRNLPEFNGKGFYLFKAKFIGWLKMKGLDDVLLPKRKKRNAVESNAIAVVNAEANEVNENAAEEKEEEQQENEEAEDENENKEEENEEEEAAAAENEEKERPESENARFARIIEEEKRINKVGYALMRALTDDVL